MSKRAPPFLRRSVCRRVPGIGRGKINFFSRLRCWFNHFFPRLARCSRREFRTFARRFNQGSFCLNDSGLGLCAASLVISWTDESEWLTVLLNPQIHVFFSWCEQHLPNISFYQALHDPRPRNPFCHHCRRLIFWNIHPFVTPAWRGPSSLYPRFIRGLKKGVDQRRERDSEHGRSAIGCLSPHSLSFEMKCRSFPN